MAFSIRPHRKIPFWLLCLSPVVICLIYLAFAPRFSMCLYQGLLFHPDKLATASAAPTIAGIRGETIIFQSSNKRQLAGWYFQNPSAKVTVLFNHGNSGNICDQTDLVELIAKAGASVFIYDYEGYGASAGTPTLAGMCDDAAGAFQYLSNRRGVKKDSIVLYGQSLGAAVAANLSSRFSCRGVILQSGFSSLRKIACEDFPLLGVYPPYLFPRPDFDTGLILSNGKPHPPLLLVHGQQDDVVPYQHAVDLFAIAKGQKKLVTFSHSGHENIAATAGSAYTNALRRFFKTLDEVTEPTHISSISSKRST